VTAKKDPLGGAEIVAPPSVKAWGRWLHAHHAKSPGVWVRFPKKGTADFELPYAEMLDVVLCYGWIDGQRRSETATTYLQKFTPRTKRSIWSKINREKALALIGSGQMQPAGLAEVERAKADGRWDAAYDGQRKAEVPPDFQAALDVKPKAKAFFATLTGSRRYSFLFRIHQAKRPETRERRIAEFVALLAQGKTLHDPK
jgi:uncharacterized protein YdeI (YjbR/CyaY-like superfamily)